MAAAAKEQNKEMVDVKVDAFLARIQVIEETMVTTMKIFGEYLQQDTKLKTQQLELQLKKAEEDHKRQVKRDEESAAMLKTFMDIVPAFLGILGQAGNQQRPHHPPDPEPEPVDINIILPVIPNGDEHPPPEPGPRGENERPPEPRRQ